jgi:hypothetical protein
MANPWRRRAWLFVAALCLTALALPARPARACGVSGPDGVWSCSLEEHEEEERPRWNAALSTSYTSTALRFGQVVRADQTRTALLASGSYAPSAALSFELSAGAALGGTLRTPPGT